MAGLVIVGFITALAAPIPEGDSVIKNISESRGKWLHTMVAAPFIEFFQRNNLGVAVVILAFILLYKFGDAFAGVMANPFYIKIGFTKVQIANVSKIFGVFATLLGVFTGGLIVKRCGILKSLLYCGILQNGFWPHVAFGHVGLGRRADRLGVLLYYFHICGHTGFAAVAVDAETPAHVGTGRPGPIVMT